MPSGVSKFRNSMILPPDCQASYRQSARSDVPDATVSGLAAYFADRHAASCAAAVTALDQPPLHGHPVVPSGNNFKRNGASRFNDAAS